MKQNSKKEKAKLTQWRMNLLRCLKNEKLVF